MAADGGPSYLARFRAATHHQETFNLPTDPLFVDKVRDTVGLYLNHFWAKGYCVDTVRLNREMILNSSVDRAGNNEYIVFYWKR
jgi:hypothetical protein